MNKENMNKENLQKFSRDVEMEKKDDRIKFLEDEVKRLLAREQELLS